MADDVQNDFSSRVKLEIVEKKMKAFLEVKEPESDQSLPITLQDLLDLISKEGIKYGVNENLLNEIIEGKKWGEKFIVAEGSPPLFGEDAKLEFYFPTVKSLRPQISEDGHIDYREISVVNSVDKDDVLIRKIAPTLGPKGMDVLGNELPGSYGKDMNILLGQGTYRDSADNMIIKASADGIIFYDEQKVSIEVQKIFLIKGSVDFSTGNVNVKSSVEIHGDVNPGFSVKTPYNIQINGTVEQATILCDGTLKVKEGIVGDGKLLIYAGGDIHSGYINNQHLKCKGSLFVGSELRNSVVDCGDEVMMLKNTGVIIGCKLYVSNKVTSATIGNKYNVPTEIEVGINFKFKETYDLKKAEIIAVHKVIDTLKKNIAQISQQAETSLNTKRILTFRDECDAYTVKLEKLRKDLQEIEKQYYDVGNPAVYVTKTVYPGTIIKLKHTTFEVKEDISHVMFKLVGDEIVTTNL
ncbi:MAG: FapA family protein [Ignavibacteriales bacterium]|nr:FapA family protein [Ignavibacteriales bacterium]